MYITGSASDRYQHDSPYFFPYISRAPCLKIIFPTLPRGVFKKAHMFFVRKNVEGIFLDNFKGQIRVSHTFPMDPSPISFVGGRSMCIFYLYFVTYTCQTCCIMYFKVKELIHDFLSDKAESLPKPSPDLS